MSTTGEIVKRAPGHYEVGGVVVVRTERSSVPWRLHLLAFNDERTQVQVRSVYGTTWMAWESFTSHQYEPPGGHPEAPRKRTPEQVRRALLRDEGERR